MKKTFIRLISLVLVLLTVAPIAAACDSSEPKESTTTTTSRTKRTTTTTHIEPFEGVEGVDTRVSENTYSYAGYQLTKNSIQKHYIAKTNWLKTEYKNANSPAVWAVGAYIENLAEAYRLCQTDKTLKDAYIASLTTILNQYRVQGATIRTPKAGNFTNITYYNASKGNSGDYYYDDNAWICIQLIEAYKLLGDKSYLDAAEKNLEFLWTGWDEENGGGIYWDKTYGGKNSCANGPVAIAFLEAYKLTNNPDYFEKGKKIFDWANTGGLLEGNLYRDSLGNHWKAAYNQGVFIHAGAQLYELTGEKQYLEHTQKVVDATVKLMFNAVGKGDKLRVSMNGNPIYKAWCIGWLARGFIKFYEVSDEKDSKPMDYLEKVLDKQLKTKDSKTGYYDPYYCSGDWKSENQTELLQVSGVASVLCLAGYFDVFVRVPAEA